MAAILLTRRQLAKTRDLTIPWADISIRNSVGVARALAPTWDMVKGHKAGTLSHTGYMEQYLDLLNERSDELLESIATLAAGKGRLCLVCFCKDGDCFCHTHFAIIYLAHFYPDIFIDARLEKTAYDREWQALLDLYTDDPENSDVR